MREYNAARRGNRMHKIQAGMMEEQPETIGNEPEEPLESTVAQANAPEAAGAETAGEEQIVYKQGFSLGVASEQDIFMNGVGALGIAAGRDMQLTDGGAFRISAGRDLDLNDGGAAILRVGGGADLKDSIVGTAVSIEISLLDC